MKLIEILKLGTLVGAICLGIVFQGVNDDALRGDTFYNETRMDPAKSWPPVTLLSRG